LYIKVVVHRMAQGVTPVTTTELPCLGATGKGVTQPRWESGTRRGTTRRVSP